MQNHKCDLPTGRQAGSETQPWFVGRGRAKAEPQITPRPRAELTSRSFYSRKSGRQMEFRARETCSWFVSRNKGIRNRHEPGAVRCLGSRETSSWLLVESRESGVFSRFNKPLILLIFPTPRSDGCSRQRCSAPPRTGGSGQRKRDGGSCGRFRSQARGLSFFR